MNSESESNNSLFEGFPTISSGVHALRVSSNFIIWCPTIDMAGFSYLQQDPKDDVNNREEIPTGLTFHRLSGQQVWSTNLGSGSGITGGAKRSQPSIQPISASWNETGRMFTLTQRDGSCKVYSSNTGKLLFTTCFAPENQEFLWTSILSATFRFPESLIQDAPFRRLGFTTITKSLPKLTFTGLGPVLPNSRYMMRQVLEDTIHSKTADVDNFEMPIQIIGTNDGCVGLSLHGTFNIGKVELDNRIKNQQEVISISSFADLSQAFVALTKTNGNIHNLYIINLDFLSSLNFYLFEVTQVPTQIDALLEYVCGEIDVVRTEIANMATAQLNFYQSLLEEAEREGDIPAGQKKNAFENLMPLFLDTLLTGIPSQCISNWISRIVKERGVKKWKKETLHGYEIIRKKIFVYLIPALERVVLLLSQLGGLIKWVHNGGSIYGILYDTQGDGNRTGLLDMDSSVVETASEQATNLIRELNSYLWTLNSEFLLYRSFCNWIEILYEEVTNIPLRDNSGEGPKIAQSTKVKEYICDVIPIIGTVPEFGQAYQGIPLNKAPAKKKMMVHKDENSERSLDYMFKRLRGTCGLIFEVIKKFLCSEVYSFKLLKVATEADITIKVHGVSRERTNAIPGFGDLGLDIGINKESTTQKKILKDSMWTYMAMHSESRPGELVLVKFKVDQNENQSSATDDAPLVEVCRIDVSMGNDKTRVIQFEFIDDQEILMLLSSGDEAGDDEEKETASLVSMSYFDLMYSIVVCKSDEGVYETAVKSCDTVVLHVSKSREFSTREVPTSSRPRSVFSKDGTDEKETVTFDEFEDAEDTEKREQLIENDFIPRSFSVNGRAGRRVGCLLERDGHRYIFFDLEGDGNEDEDEDDDDDDDDDENEDEDEYEDENDVTELIEG